MISSNKNHLFDDLFDENNRMKFRLFFSFFANKINEFVNELNNRIKSRSFFSFFEHEKHDVLININEFNKIQTKKNF